MRIARYRLRLARRALGVWAAAAVLALASGAVIDRATRTASSARAMWGASDPVLVTTRPVAAGDPVDRSNTTLRAVPRGLTGGDALTRPIDGAVAAVALSSGEIVRTFRLVGGAVPPPGSRLVGVPRDSPSPDIRIGDHVDLIAGEPAPATVAVDVVVIAADAAHVVVAADEAAASALAQAVLSGPVAITVRR